MSIEFKGALTAIVTPFSSDGKAVDFDSLKRLVDFQLRSKIDGIVVCGSTGEAATLREDEYRDVVSFVRAETKGKVPCIAGIGTNDTSRAVELAAWLDTVGLDALLVVAPPYNKPPQKGIIAHFTAIRGTTGLPLIAYNIPGRSGVNIQPSTLAAMHREGVINAVKESSGNVDNTLEITMHTDRKLPVLSGEDAQVIAIMANGGTGVISATGNVIPERFVAMTHAALEGDFATALREQVAALPIVKAVFMETNPIPAKVALTQMGVLKHATVRLPLVAAEAATVTALTQLLHPRS